MSQSTKLPKRLNALDAVWEQYRMSHMFPELAGISTRNLLEQLVRITISLETRVAALETKPRRRPRKSGGRK